MTTTTKNSPTCHGSAMKIFIMLCFMCVLSVAHAESSDDYLKEAKEYAKKGDINAAIIQLKNALQKDPKNAKARFFLGENYLTKGDGASAEKELLRAERLGMTRQEIVVPLARAMLQQGQADKTLKDIKVESDFPAETQADLYVLHANAYMMLKKNNDAATSFEKAIKLVPNSLNALAGQTRLALVNQDVKRAKKLADNLIKAHSESDTAWALHGETSRLVGDMESARKSFDQAIALQPYNLAALLGSARVKLALGDKEGAEKRIVAAQRISPNHPTANYLMATLRYTNKDVAGAEESLQKVFKVAPNHLPSKQLMGAIDFSKGRYEQADQALSQVVEVFPANVAAAKLLAATRLKLKQPEEAIKALKKVLLTAPDDAQLLALAGTAYMQNNQTVEGMDYLEKAVAAAPDTAGIRTQLALGRLASGKTSQAVEELETAVDLGQNVLQADVLLIMVHLREKAFDKALKQIQIFAKKIPKSPLPYNLMGAAYVGLEKMDKARESFQLSLTKEPKFLPAIMNLARLDESEGKTEKARQRYKDILKQRDNHLGALLSLARLADKEGKEDEAIRLLEKAWESNEGALQPGIALVRYYNQKQQSLRAVSIARDLNTKYPKNPLAVNALGLSQAASKDHHAAKSTFETLVKLLPKSPQPHFALGRVNAQLGDTKAAKESLEKSLSLDKRLLPAQLFLAQLEIKDKQPKAALAIAKTIQKQRPSEPAGYRLQGDVLMFQGKYSEAVAPYEKAYEKSQVAVLAIAIYQARKKAKHKKPYVSLETWLKTHADDYAVRSILASAYQEHGMMDKAAEEYRKVVKNRPKDVAALNNLAWSSHMLGRADALDYAERAYKLASDNPAVADTYGWLLVETGKTSRGLELLQKAVVKAPHIAEIRYHLGVGLHKAGRKSEAKSELKRALDISPNFSEAKSARALLAEK